MKKIIQKNNILLIFIVIVFIAGILSFFEHKKEKNGLIIGILQTASHPALDNAREGFIQELKNEFGNSVKFITKNGQGSIGDLHTIAKSFHENSDINGIFAIATPALQAIAVVEKEKPIFISAVTDPVALGLVTPKCNISGSSDKINIEDQIMLITSFFPAIKSVGIIYNTGEINSVRLTQEMKQALQKKNINVLEIGITNDAEIPMALATAMPNIELLWAPTDNTMASAISFIAQKMREQKKPFIVSDNLLVEKGALTAAGVDYFKSGQQAAHIAHDILIQHKKPSELEILKPIIEHIVVNEDVLHELNLTMPKNLKKPVVFVHTMKEK